MAIRTLKDTGSEYPIPCEVDGSVYSLITGDCVIAGRGDEFTLNYTTSSLIASIKKGSQAVLCGNAFWITDDESVTLPASSTFYLCLRIDTSQPNGQTGSLVCLTESAMKSDNINEGGIRDMALYKIITSSSGIATCEDVRKICDASTYATKPVTYSNIAVSVTPTKMSSYNTWDTEQKYGYSATITVAGVTENSLIQNIVMTDTLLSAIANVVTTTTNGLIFYTEDETALSGTIYTLIVSEVG